MKIQSDLEKFVNDRKDWEDKHIQLVQLFELTIIKIKLEKNRSNTSMLVWWLIALPFLVLITIFLFALIGVTI